VKALEAALQRRLRGRTLALLARALPGWREARVPEAGDAGPPTRSSVDGAPRKP
jgi:hypothetical protein